MSEDQSRPLILTARMDPKAQAFFDDKREQYFPEKINYLKAHLTLFHKLPGSQLEEINTFLSEKSSETSNMEADASEVIFMGFGSAYKIECHKLKSLRSELAAHWESLLTKQDAQGFRPHVTFQNKAEPDEAKKLFKEEQERFRPFSLSITGLSLWFYDGGPWEHIKDYAFNDSY